MTKISEIEKLSKNRAYHIEIFSFSNERYSPKRKTIKFPAFLTDFTDSYKSNWREEEVYGKMDPIATFKNTARSISLSFDIPSDSLETARENLKQLDFLIKGLYPVYDSGVLGTATLASPPMFRIRFSNLVRNVSQTNDNEFLRTGLLCYIKNFDFKPKVDSGFFTSGGQLFPKLVSATLNLSIIHEHALGKMSNNGQVEYRTNFDGFPHSIGKARLAEYNKNNATSKQSGKTIEQAESDNAESDCLGD